MFGFQLYISDCLSSLHRDSEVRGHFGFRLSMKHPTCMTIRSYHLPLKMHERMAQNDRKVLEPYGTTMIHHQLGHVSGRLLAAQHIFHARLHIAVHANSGSNSVHFF